jgi:hypothetical protein
MPPGKPQVMSLRCLTGLLAGPFAVNSRALTRGAATRFAMRRLSHPWNVSRRTFFAADSTSQVFKWLTPQANRFDQCPRGWMCRWLETDNRAVLISYFTCLLLGPGLPMDLSATRTPAYSAGTAVFAAESGSLATSESTGFDFFAPMRWLCAHRSFVAPANTTGSAAP